VAEVEISLVDLLVVLSVWQKQINKAQEKQDT